jgi:predicted O-linked N-acetylglucosamine transferase (SPINDLY family)
VAKSEGEYVALAVKLAEDKGRRSELRRTLRERMKKSALMDGVGFARDVEAAYRAAWVKWCESKG